MKVTLRKASVLQNALQDLIRTISLKTSVSVNEFSNPGAVISAAQRDFESQLARKQAAISATYAIRGAVAQANHASGINQMLTEVAEIQANITLLESFTNQGVEAMMPGDEVDARLAKIRNRPADARASIYGLEDSVSTSVLSVDRLAQLRRTLLEAKKAKQALQDRILETNVRTEVELGAAAEFLKAEGLI